MITSPDMGCKVEKKAISRHIIDKMGRLSSRMEELSKRTVSKLEPVMRPISETPSSELNKTREAYPPLFDEMEGLLNSQINSVEIIEDALSRTEL